MFMMFKESKRITNNQIEKLRELRNSRMEV